MNKNLFFKSVLVVFAVISLVSCDNNSNEIGTNIVGNDNFNLTTETYPVTAYNQALGVVETGNLPINQLGIYNNPVFGQTIAHFATQVQLAIQNPTIYDNPIIESVVLTIPYFNHVTMSNPAPGVNDPANFYEIDSIYGPSASKMDLKVYESGYYMRDIDPETGLAQKFYADQYGDFDAAKLVQLNTATVPAENSDFFFNSAGYKEVGTDGTTSADVGPRMKLTLDKDWFQNKLFGPAAAGQLLNNNLFKNYFRGLFFKIGNSGADVGQLAMLNFAGGSILIKYKDGLTVPQADREITLNLVGNTVNLLQQTENPTYLNAITNPNTTTGDPLLYLRGQGAMSVVELFKNQDELDAFRSSNKKWLVNDAEISFYIEKDAMAVGNPQAEEPNRIYIYDLKNRTPLIDYLTDQTASAVSPKFAKKVHGGIITKTDDGRGTYYKFKITNHIRNIISKDSTNVRLGIVVTENINVITRKALKVTKTVSSPGVFGDYILKDIPTMSVANPFGTILYGGTDAVPEDKRLKLIVHYTKPN